MHGYLLGLSTVRPRIRCKLIRGQPYLRPTIAPQQQGEKYQQHQDGKASHVMAPPLIVCTVPGADQEGGSRALFIYPHSPRPATLCRQMPRVPGTVRACRRTGTESQGPYRMGKWDEYRRDDVECRITEYHWQRGLRQLNRWISLSNGGFYLKRKLL